MAGTVGVLCAVRGAREVDLVTRLEQAEGPWSLARRCADVAELVAAGRAGIGRLAVVSADLPGLDVAAVAELRAAGVLVVALADPPDGWLSDRARSVGAARVVPFDLVEEVVAELATDDGAFAAAALAAPRAVGSSGETQVPDDLGALPWGVGGPPDGAAPPRERGQLVAVWGPTGAPGRTSVAVNLSAELAGLPGADALLVDADTYGGTVAQVLGMLEESPGLAAAARMAGQGVLDAAALALHAPFVSERLRVLTGISRAARWPELPGPALDVVWEVVRDVAAWTVVDCGFSLEDDEALSYDTRAPRRNAATLSALSAADAVVVVGSADPVGVQRLVRALVELDEVSAPRRCLVVANRVRAAVAGPRPAEAVAAALDRYAGVDQVYAVPQDAASFDAALLAGRMLREHAPASPARKAFARLASVLADGSATARRVPEPAAERAD